MSFIPELLQRQCSIFLYKYTLLFTVLPEAATG